MREILFRGKNRYENQWVYGAYSLWDYSPETESMTTDTSIIDYNDECLWVRVIPETVGQYTGLTDKNGKEIFEGDIVTTNYKLGRGGYYTFEVYYNENLCQFALTINSGSYTKNKQYDWLQLTALKAKKIEVIGNIHDNPELLEVLHK